MNAIDCRGLRKTYEGFALHDLSFSLPSGTILGLVGENGAGKSTTLRLLMNTIGRDAGSVSLLGVDNQSKDFLRVKQDIGIVLDESCLPETLTAREVGKLMALTYERWEPETFSGYLTRFSIPLDKANKDFSRGMKMKLALAVALSHRAKLLLLDEATSGLDPVVREDILDVFWEFVQDERHSILMSSHITSDLEKIADCITFLHQGKLLFCKPKDELRYQYGVLRCGEAQFKRLDSSEILVYRKEPCQIDVLVADKEAARRRHPDMVVDDATIDDILLLYVKGERVK